MLGLLLIAVLLWVLRKPMSLDLVFYFSTQLLYTPVIWAVAWLYGDHSTAYFFTYIGMTWLILLAIGSLVFEELKPFRYRGRAAACAALVAATFTELAYYGSAQPFGPSHWVVLFEGFVLTWAAILIGATAAYAKRKDIPLLLMGLWFLQALVDYGWVLHWPRWQEASWIVGPLLEMAAFLLIGWRLTPRAVPRMPQHS